MDKVKLNFESVLRLREPSDKIVLTNGCFDLLHVGHIEFLQKSAQLGSLWVALDIDLNVRKNKGPKRPINNFVDRAKLLGALECVDLIFPLVDSETFAWQILQLKPNFYTKSSQYSIKVLDKQEKKSLLDSKTQIKIIDNKEDYSTTGLIEKIKNS